MRTLKFKTTLVAPSLVIGLWATGCNVDGRWAQLQIAGLEVANSAALTPTTAGSDDFDIPEVDLVESVLNHRTQYRRDLHRLYEHYRRHGDATKANWAAYELKGLGTVKQFKYFLDAEVAPKDFAATESVPEADDLLDRGLDFMRQGGHGIPLFYREDRMVEAADTLRILIKNHPTSDKIDDAAFYLGEIHRSYFPGQELLAVQWYERAFSWDPGTPHPARFHAAVLYDDSLQERGRALELYHGVLEHDSNAGHVQHATRRIAALSATRWNADQRSSDASTP